MSNFLKNGTVLPFGLNSATTFSNLNAFKKTYQNYAIKLGVIINTYEIKDKNNKSKILPEYDVLVFEQNEDRGSTTITYKNCLAASSFNSKADFVDLKLRKIKKVTKKSTPDLGNHDGSLVLLLCLNGSSEQGIIVGSLPHPARTTTLSEEGLRFEAEYNGVNIKIEKDGSCKLTFKGATDNDGKPLDSSQGNTSVSIEKDGSFQVDHDKINVRLDRSGDLSINCVNATIQAENIKLGEEAAESIIKGDTFKKIYDTLVVPTPMGPSGTPIQKIPSSALSKKVKTE